MTNRLPPPTLLKPGQAYDLWASSYPPYAHNALMKAEEGAMLSLMPAHLKGYQVLDAGCGTGRYLIHAAKRGARRLVGVDLSAAMLTRADQEWRAGQKRGFGAPSASIILLRASLEAIPLQDDWANLTICALTLGHFRDLSLPLTELWRVTRPGGKLLCSDLHPLGNALGWQRTFKVGEQRYAIENSPHPLEHWQQACRTLNLIIVEVLEPYLSPADIPEGAPFDPRILEVPVALVLELRRRD